MRKVAQFVLMAAMPVLLSACTAASGTAPLLGADRDAHGCIGSAGYVWSPLLQTCVQPWEAGERLLPAAAPRDGSAQAAAYVIRRGDEAEVFAPDLDEPQRLERLVDEWAGGGMLLERRGNALMLTLSGGKVYLTETLKNEAPAQ